MDIFKYYTLNPYTYKLYVHQRTTQKTEDGHVIGSLKILFQFITHKLYHFFLKGRIKWKIQ